MDDELLFLLNANRCADYSKFEFFRSKRDRAVFAMRLGDCDPAFLGRVGQELSTLDQHLIRWESFVPVKREVMRPHFPAMFDAMDAYFANVS